MISKVVPKAVAFFRASLIRRPVFVCSTEQKQEKENRNEQQLDKVANFYRNSVRKINVDRQGRGKFTEHALLRLVKLTQNHNQVPILFQAYYNYLGHYAVISSTTVDQMLSKAMDFKEVSLEPVIEVYSVHNYLAYFPHYLTTFKLIKLIQNDPGTFKKFLNICYYSPLIKFDGRIVKHLMSLLKTEGTDSQIFFGICKLLQQRSTLGVLDQQISREEMSKFLTEIKKGRQGEEDSKASEVTENEGSAQ